MIFVGFSTTNKLMSRLIRLFTRGRASHAWVSFFDPYLKARFVVQAEAWGLELRPWGRWERENRIVKMFRIRGRDGLCLDDKIRDLVDLVGTPYDWRAAASAGWIRFFGRSARGVARGGLGRLMCSEATVRFLQSIDVPAAKGLDPERTTPNELMELLRDSSIGGEVWCG